MALELFENHPKDPPKGWVKKMGIFGWDGDELWMSPLLVGMSEQAAFLNCSFDGEQLMTVNNMVLVKEAWVREQAPHLKDQLDFFRSRATDIRKNLPPLEEEPNEGN